MGMIRQPNSNVGKTPPSLLLHFNGGTPIDGVRNVVANALKVQWWLRRATALDLGGTMLGKGIHINEGAAMVEICYFGDFGLLPHWIWMELC
ncbi:hypothetical protein DEO72_LG5g3316 [Vigna unguiculata]|uniref:Uncharacterized protein n=1 Tax=Vigna unguiculata TaxID=3917 RepID=A0A4D6M3B9_VIGUN|nr:hypothetical protein DEO72_LG5g3316 [Vigna unguiculata]